MPRSVEQRDRAMKEMQERRDRFADSRDASRNLALVEFAIEALGPAPYGLDTHDGRYPGTREMRSNGYTVVFEVEPDDGRNETDGLVRVLRVFGPKQDIVDPWMG